MRLVLDTNTVIAGLLWQGTPGKLIEAAQARTISIFTSAPLLAELRGVLSRRKFALGSGSASGFMPAGTLRWGSGNSGSNGIDSTTRTD